MLAASLFTIKVPIPAPVHIPSVTVETPKIVEPTIESKPEPQVPSESRIELPYRGEMPPLVHFYPSDIPLKMSYDEPLRYEIHERYHNILTDVGDVALLPPELVLDTVIGTFDALLGIRSNTGTITSKILDFHVEPTRAHLFSVFTENLLKRESRYFAGFGDSYLNTIDVQNGNAQIQSSDLMADQRKVLWDVGKNTYFSKYRIKVDNIKDEAFYFTDWRGIDFAVLPPLVSAYLYYRGFEKKIAFLDTEAKLTMEPLQAWIGHQNLLVGAGVEWAPKGWPVKLLVAVGADNGDVNLQFIGIGTSIGTVKQLLFSRQAEPLR